MVDIKEYIELASRIERHILEVLDKKDDLEKKEEVHSLRAETARVCNLTTVDRKTFLARGGSTEPALPSADELIPDIFQETK